MKKPLPRAALTETGTVQPWFELRPEFRPVDEQGRYVGHCTGFLDAPAFCPAGNSFGYPEDGSHIPLAHMALIDGRLA